MNPHVNQGQPTIRGTEVTVAHLLQSLRAGQSPEDLALGHAVPLAAVHAIWSELGAQ